MIQNVLLTDQIFSDPLVLRLFRALIGYMGESFQDLSWIQDFEDDFPQRVILKMLN